MRKRKHKTGARLAKKGTTRSVKGATAANEPLSFLSPQLRKNFTAACEKVGCEPIQVLNSQIKGFIAAVH